MNLMDYLQPQANSAAASATQAAIDQAAQKPFQLVLSVSQDTQVWIGLLILGGLIAGVVFKKL